VKWPLLSAMKFSPLESDSSAIDGVRWRRTMLDDSHVGWSWIEGAMMK
jgi:hypothetical protein